MIENLLVVVAVVARRICNSKSKGKQRAAKLQGTLSDWSPLVPVWVNQNYGSYWLKIGISLCQWCVFRLQKQFDMEK